MPPETVQLFVACRVPQTNGLVLPTRENPFAIGRKRDTVHLSGVPPQSTNFLAGFEVIELNGSVGAARQCKPAIRRESDTFDETRWTLKLVQLLSFVTIDHAEEPIV